MKILISSDTFNDDDVACTDEELLNLLPHKWKLQHPESALTKQEEESGTRY